jgi:hypothetical protein
MVGSAITRLLESQGRKVLTVDRASELSGELLRLDSNCRVMLQFHGSVITFDAGLLAYQELDDALRLTAVELIQSIIIAIKAMLLQGVRRWPSCLATKNALG